MYAPSTTRPAYFQRLEEAVLSSTAWTWIASAVDAVVTYFRTCHTIRELNALTDRQLHDIGLRRAEIENAAARSSIFRA
jgi:uncharacterized protein YjiS (DUF1127 family)